VVVLQKLHAARAVRTGDVGQRGGTEQRSPAASACRTAPTSFTDAARAELTTHRSTRSSPRSRTDRHDPMRKHRHAPKLPGLRGSWRRVSCHGVTDLNGSTSA